MPETPFFRDIALVFVAALVGGAIAQWLRQPLFVGYVIGGLLVSPFTPGPAIQDVRTFELFAQIGVILLMFSIGIEFSLHEMTRLGAPAVLGAPAAMALIIAAGIGAGMLAGWPLSQGVSVGIVISVASTMVVAKLLAERGEINAPHARLVIGTVLMEDILVVALIVLLPVLAGQQAGRLGSVVLALGRAALVLVPFFYLANRVVPRIMARVARQRNTELFIMVAMAIGIGTAALSNRLGLSLALGAFLAGLIISESQFTHEVLARVLPMRDIFGALFFVSVGTLIRPRDVVADLPLLFMLLALVLGAKFVLRVLVLRAFRYPWPAAALVSVHLAQTGEFSFVLALVARGAGLVTDSIYHALLAASLVSILITAVVTDLGHRWIEEPLPAPRMPEAGERPAPQDHVLICGFGRVGSAVGEALEAFRIPFTVVDLDFAVIEAVRQRGLACVYGDAASEPVLRQAGAATARLAVVATPDFERTRLAVRRLRTINPDVPILARAGHVSQREALIEAGATEVIQPEFEAAQTLIRHGLDRLGVPHDLVKAFMEEERAAHAGVIASPLPAHHLLRTKVVRVGEGDYADASLRRARIRERTGAWVLSIRRPDGTEVVNPSPDTVLRAGDEVTVIGLPEEIARFESLAQRAEAPTGRRRLPPE